MMKYIRLEHAGFVIFEQSQKHADVAQKFPNDTVISAGFVSGTMEEDQIWAEGQSQSLHKSAKDEDSSWLWRRISIY